MLNYSVPLDYEDYLACDISSISDKRSFVASMEATGENKRCTKILVCHDMKGGYLNDCDICGDQFESGYQLFHWNAVDVFCYFSHTLITVPPLPWVNNARRHGARCIGTFITEWDNGARICDHIFSSEDGFQRLATLLTKLALFNGFHGWLINIENKLDPKIHVPNVLKFLQVLRKMMSESIDGSLLMWYDAVTIDGELRWQNQLTTLNRPFFDCCDAIFINYTWKENDPIVTVAMMQDSYTHHTLSDVFFGCDVFGRGSFAGGQWRTYEAVALLSSVGLSSALFAPGWTLENCVEEFTAEKEHVDANETALISSSSSSSHRSRRPFENIELEFLQTSARLWDPILAALVASRASEDNRDDNDCMMRHDDIYEERKDSMLLINFSVGAGKHIFIEGSRFPHWSRYSGSYENEGFYDLSLHRGNWDISSLTHKGAARGAAILDCDEGAKPYVDPRVDASLCFNYGYCGTSSLKLSCSTSALTCALISRTVVIWRRDTNLKSSPRDLVRPSASPSKRLQRGVDSTRNIFLTLACCSVASDGSSCDVTIVLTFSDGRRLLCCRDGSAEALEPSSMVEGFVSPVPIVSVLSDSCRARTDSDGWWVRDFRVGGTGFANGEISRSHLVSIGIAPSSSAVESVNANDSFSKHCCVRIGLLKLRWCHDFTGLPPRYSLPAPPITIENAVSPSQDQFHPPLVPPVRLAQASPDGTTVLLAWRCSFESLYEQQFLHSDDATMSSCRCYGQCAADFPSLGSLPGPPGPRGLVIYSCTDRDAIAHVIDGLDIRRDEHDCGSIGSECDVHAVPPELLVRYIPAISSSGNWNRSAHTSFSSSSCSRRVEESPELAVPFFPVAMSDIGASEVLAKLCVGQSPTSNPIMKANAESDPASNNEGVSGAQVIAHPASLPVGLKSPKTFFLFAVRRRCLSCHNFLSKGYNCPHYLVGLG